jgi:hypothetical protein
MHTGKCIFKHFFVPGITVGGAEANRLCYGAVSDLTAGGIGQDNIIFLEQVPYCIVLPTGDRTLEQVAFYLAAPFLLPSCSLFAPFLLPSCSLSLSSLSSLSFSAFPFLLSPLACLFHIVSHPFSWSLFVLFPLTLCLNHSTPT